MPCQIPKCERSVYATGLCQRHHNVAFLVRHPGYANRARKKYREAHPEKIRANRRRVGGRFSSGRTQAKQRGVVWTLSLPEYTILISRPCYWCDGPLNPTGSGLDRLDHRGGYTPDNVVPSCLPCNVLKGRIEGCGFKYPRTVELMRELNSDPVLFPSPGTT